MSRYIPAVATDIRKTFQRERRRLVAEGVPTTVTRIPLARRTEPPVRQVRGRP